MCGICGYFGAISEDVVRSMVVAMRHRGPDDHGVLIDSHVGLGATRLAILDLGRNGHQPMSNTMGTLWIAYNGEVYNFADERRLLEAHGRRFRSSSDTEVVLAMYEHYGDDFVRRLRGMFALAIYDKREGPGRERLYLARDHFGIKPLLIARRPGATVFASELKALLHGGVVGKDIDAVSLRQLLTYGAVRQPRTILRNVETLPPGCRMILERGRETLEPYSRLASRRRSELANASYKDLLIETQRVLDESIKMQMVSDVPLGAFLSGGIDSTLLVALMARHAGHRLRTYSIGFDDDGKDIDESGVASRTSDLLGTSHTHVNVSGRDVKEELPLIIRGLDQPSVDGVNGYFVSRAARRGVTVSISGLGGDELFAGYPWWFDSMLNEQAWDDSRPMKARCKRMLANICGRAIWNKLAVKPAGRIIRYCRDFESIASRFAARSCVFAPHQVARLLHPDLHAMADLGTSYHSDYRRADELSSAGLLERISGLCLRSYMVDQLLRDTDAVSMFHSLEVRVPYLDPQVVDTALSLPLAAKFDANHRQPGEIRGKRVLRDLVDLLCPGRPRLPEKRGFNLPFAAWLRSPLLPLVRDTLSDSNLASIGWLNPSSAESIVDAFLAGKGSWPQVWVLTVLVSWERDSASGVA